MKRALTVLIVLGCAGCSGPQDVLNPAGDEAAKLYSLWGLMLWVCGIAYLLVLIFLAGTIWRARRQLVGPPQTDPRDPGLERGLATWAAFIVIGLGVLAGASFLVDRSLARQGDGGAPSVRVTGQQWWWRIEYRQPGGGWIETANELHLPVNRPTQVEIVSSDVIHSFWIPNLSGKIDMVPGRVNLITLTPRRLGWVRGQCAEFCGLQHAQMALDVKVDSAADYAAWLAVQARPASPTAGVASRGYQLVADGVCSNCHTIRGTPAVARAGPDLTHVASRRTLAAGTLPMGRGALIGWISQPQALKPGAEMPATSLSASDADAVAAYLEGLR